MVAILDGTLQPVPGMRLAVELSIALLACGCVDAGERATTPRTPADQPFDDAVSARATGSIDDDFDDAVSHAPHIPPPAEHPPSRSLGYIGDQPIGELPDPPHRAPAWTRPFPCDWTGTCRLVPYEPPYVEVYSGP